MRIYDEGMFLSHLDVEIAKCHRFNYYFSLVGILDLSKSENNLLYSILEADYRATDVVAFIEPNKFYVLLNCTNKESAKVYLKRVLEKAKKHNLKIQTAILEYNGTNTEKRDDLLYELEKMLKS